MFVLIELYYWVGWVDNPKKVEHLTSLDGAKERLHLFKADLLDEGSFGSAIQGCDGVFHTASPFYHDVKDPEVSLSFFTANYLLVFPLHYVESFFYFFVGKIMLSIALPLPNQDRLTA